MRENNIFTVVSRVVPGWRYDSNHTISVVNGRIVVAWNPSVSLVTYLKMINWCCVEYSFKPPISLSRLGLRMGEIEKLTKYLFGIQFCRLQALLYSLNLHRSFWETLIKSYLLQKCTLCIRTCRQGLAW